MFIVKFFIDKIIQFDEFIEENIEDIANKFFLYFFYDCNYCRCYFVF